MTSFAKAIFSSQAIAVKQREWGYLFNSAIGAIFLAIFLIAVGHLSFDPGRGAFFFRGQADLQPFFDYLPWVMAFFVPAISMRSWAEERKSGSIEFLLTLPVATHQAVWGKFLSAWKFLGLTLILTTPIVFTVFYLGSPDVLTLVVGYLGAWLLSGQMLAIGLFASSLSKNQVTSFILGSVLLIVFLMLDSPSIVRVLDSFLPGYPLAVIENLSLLKHFEPWSQGLIKLGDLLYMLLSICFWNWCTAKTVDEFKSV